MAYPKNFPTPPKNFSYERATELKEALQIMLPKELGLSEAQVKNKLSTKHYSWNNPIELSRFARELTGQPDIKSADYVLSLWQENYTQAPEYPEGTTNMTGAPEYPVSATTPTEPVREMQQEELKRQEEGLETTTKESKAAVAAAIKRQQDIYEQQLKKIPRVEKETKDKEVYVKKEEPQLSKEEQEAIGSLKEEINANPRAAVEALRQEIRSRVDETVPDAAVTLTAVNIVANLQTNSAPTVQAAVSDSIAKGTIKVGGKEITDMTAVLSDQSQNLKAMSDAIAASAFGQNFAGAVFPKVEVSQTPMPDYQPISLGYIPPVARNIIETQSAVLKKTVPNIEIETNDFVERWMNQMGQGTVPQGIIAQRTSVVVSGLPNGQPTTWDSMGGNTRLNLSTGLSEPMGIVGGVAKMGARKLAGKAATAVATRLGLKATLAAAGSAVPGLGNAAGLVIGEVLSRINPKTLKKWFLFGLAVPVAVVGIVLGIPMVTIGGLALGGYGYASAQGLTAAAIGNGILGVAGAIGSATLGAIGGPILAILLGFPVAVALILFIINSGAYVVPQSSLSALRGQDNPYMLITKVASQDKISNPFGKTSVMYTVTITALKSPLSNIRITNTTCKVTKKSGGKVKCPIEKIPDIPSETVVSPASPYSLSFQVVFDSSLADSIVFDSVEISASVLEAGEITSSGSEAVCIGDCPTSCIKVVDNGLKWPNSLRSNVESAATTISSSFPKFAARVCGSGEINICYNPSQIDPGYFAWHKHTSSCDVVFNEKGISTEKNATFLLTHEVTHHIQTIDKSTVVQYINSGAYSEVRSGGFCSYSDTAGSETESMAEAAGLYASIPSWGGCVSNYRTKYPRNYNWAKGFME